MSAEPVLSHIAEREGYLKLLTGSGIEIGALHRPCVVPHLKVKYVDRLSKQDLLKQYPELTGLPIVEADILDDGQKLATLADGSQDFVIANHVIEHMASPIEALLNWGRVLRKGGRLFVAAPDKRYTFDKARDITPLEHVIEDYRAPSAERDFEHFLEFALYVSCRTFNVKPEAEYKEFAQYLWDINYSIHYHVWDFKAFFNLLKWMSTELKWDMHIIGSMKPVHDEFIFVFEKA